MYKYIHTHTHTHIHTYIHTHTQIVSQTHIYTHKHISNKQQKPMTNMIYNLNNVIRTKIQTDTLNNQHKYFYRWWKNLINIKLIER